jgi:Rps23 Pro-64 3,4-dihydroxylase Tpa1-like proline 4-hydroxylase
MNEEIYNQLTTKGFYTTKINPNITEKLKEIFSKIKDIEFRDATHTCCGKTGFTHNTDFVVLEELKKEYAPQKKWQFWYTEPNLNKHLSNTELEYLKDEIFRDLVKQCYPSELYKLDSCHLTYTMYNKQCYINKHQDGLSPYKICNILLYLNEDYKDGYGGELVINDDVVVKPEFGTLAVLDFTKANPRHEVTEVLDDNFKRFAILTSFIYNSSKIEYL